MGKKWNAVGRWLKDNLPTLITAWTAYKGRKK